MLTFDDNDRLFVGNSFQLNKFDSIYDFLLLEHATDLFTPKKLLSDIKETLKTKSSLVYFSGSQLLEYLENNQPKPVFNKFFKKNEKVQKFKKLYGTNYQLYVLYCDPINDIDKFSWQSKKQIQKYFLENRNCPAARFFDKKCSIIVLNANIIPLYSGNELELQLDHELNHIFDKLSDKQYPDLNESIQQEILKYFTKLNILENEIDKTDFSIHMFSSNEFFEMLANLCNVVSLYFNESDNFKVYQKLMSMLTENYLSSNEFKQLDSQVQGAIIFAFICKKYNPMRWNKLITAVKRQLDLTGFANNLKLCLKSLSDYFKNFKK